MHNGHIHDPRMNTEEKEYGILISSDTDRDGRPKVFPYLKDESSRPYTFGTPVTFALQTRKVPFDTDCRGEEKFVTIEVATNVRVDKEKIKQHKIVRRLNMVAKRLLSKNETEDANKLIL